MRHVHSNAKLMMVGNNSKNQTKSNSKDSKTSGSMKKSSSHSGRTSPGLNVKRFTIPKKQKELLNEVELDSSEYLREVLPIIQQGYRDSSSKNKFNYVKVQLIHNPALKKEFMEKKREMKDGGRNEKELTESYAFICVQKEDKVRQLCKSSLEADTKERHKRHCLGSPKWGVHVCRYSDVIQRNGVPKEGMLVLFKILKGKVKAVPLVYGAAEILEPTPNYDCHVAKTSGEELPSSASHRLFDSSELFVYDFDDDEVEFRKRPRNVCPYAVVHFTYSDTGIASSTASSSNFNRTPVASSNETTPTRNISIPDTVGIAVVAPCFPREEVITQRPTSDVDRPFGEKYREYSDRSYRVWSGQLHNKNGNSCRVSLVSFGLSFLPCKMPDDLHALKAVRIKELRLPTKVFTGTVPVLSRVKEAQANGKYYWYAELHSLSLDDAVYSRFLNYLSEKDLVLKKELGDKVLLYILPTGKTTQNLGLTASSHPKLMHCLVESYRPMISHLTDITVKQPRHQVKPNLESAPIHDIEKDHLKRLRFQSSLAKLFYEQNRELKDMGVKGDSEEVPVPVTVPRQTSAEQVEQDEPVVVVTAEMSPASPVAEQVDENLNTYIPGSQHFDPPQSNQRTASRSNSETLPADNHHTEHPAENKPDWKNSSKDERSKHPSGGTPSWDRTDSHSNQHKEHDKQWLDSKQVHANSSGGAPSWDRTDSHSNQHKEHDKHWVDTKQVHANSSGGAQSWDPPHSQSNQQKEHDKHWVDTKQVHANSSGGAQSNQHTEHWAETKPVHGNQDKHFQKQSRRDSDTSNQQASQQIPRNQPHSSYTPDHRLSHQPYDPSRRPSYERQSSMERASPQASPRGLESRSYQDYHYERHPPKPPENNQYRHPENDQYKRPENEQYRRPENDQYKRRSSTDWTDQQPSAKQKPYQDRLSREAPRLDSNRLDLPPQIKEVASRVHNMLTGGMDLGLGGAGGDVNNVQRVREETDDEKIARMRATLQALVEEREKLAKNNTDKNSANPPTSVASSGNEVSSSPSTSTDSTLEPKHPPPDMPKEIVAEKPTENIDVDKPKETVKAAGNGNEMEMKMEGVEVAEEIIDNAVDKDKSDGVKDELKEGVGEEKVALNEGKEEEKIVQETDSVKRKLEELEGPVKKKMKVNVQNEEAETNKNDVPKNPVPPKSIEQTNVEKPKTITKSISKDGAKDQKPKATSNQEPVIAKKPDQKQIIPMTKTQRDQEQKKVKTVEKKGKSDVKEKSVVSKNSESGDKASKEIHSASQMRDYLEKRRTSTDKKKDHISSASEMRMFLENPDKVPTKPRRIKSASEMRQFLNKSVVREKSTKINERGRSDSDRPRPELEGKSRDDLLKNYDGDLAGNLLQTFLTTHHQINWSLSQGLRVTVNRDQAGARIGLPPPGSSTRNEGDGCTSSINAVCHGSYRSMNGTHPDTSTKEGLAYQIRQVIHHSRPVKKVEPRKVKEIQKSDDQKKLSSPRDSTDSKEQGKKRGNSKPTAKHHSRNMKQDTKVKKNFSSSETETPIIKLGSKDMPQQDPKEPIKLKIKKTQKSYATIPGTEKTLEKTTAKKVEQSKDLTRHPLQRNKHKDKTKTGSEKSSGLYVSVKRLPKAILEEQPNNALDKNKKQVQAVAKGPSTHTAKTILEQRSNTALDQDQNQVQAVANGQSIDTTMSTNLSKQDRLNKTDRGENDHHDRVMPPPLDITAAVRDVVRSLSADQIRQVIGLYDDVFSRRPNSSKSLQVPKAQSENLDEIEASPAEPQPFKDNEQSGLKKEDQDGEGKNENIPSSCQITVLNTCMDEKGDHPPGIPSCKKEKVDHSGDKTKPLMKDHASEQGIPFLDKIKVEHPVQPLANNFAPEQGIPFLEKIKVEPTVDKVKPMADIYAPEQGIPLLAKMNVEPTVDQIKPLVGNYAPEQGIPFLPKMTVEPTVDQIKPLADNYTTEEGIPLLQKVKVEPTIDQVKPFNEDRGPKEDSPFTHEMIIEHLVDEMKPLVGQAHQEMGISGLQLEEGELPPSDLEQPEDEDTLPYPLEADQAGTSEIYQDAASSSGKKAMQNEACIDLYDSERWSELDEEAVQADASKEQTLNGDAPKKGHPEATAKVVKEDAGSSAKSLISSFDVNQNDNNNLHLPMSRECKTEPSITNQTEGTKRLSAFERLSEVEETKRLSAFDRLSGVEGKESSRLSTFERLSEDEQKKRDFGVDEKDNSVDPEMSLESGDKLHRNEPTSSLGALSEASQSTLAKPENTNDNEEKSFKMSVFDRLNTKKPSQEPPKKRVSVFDRLYVPKPDKPIVPQKEPTKLERVSAFDRLASRKVTKSSTQDKPKQKVDASQSRSSSKVEKEKTVKSVISGEAKKGKSVKAPPVISSKIVPVKSNKADEVVQKERHVSDKSMPKDVPKSRKRELPKEDVPASKKYKLATKDKDKDLQKENAPSNRDDKGWKDPTKKSVKDLQSETVASSIRLKPSAQFPGKKEEKDKDLQREKLSPKKKLKSVPKEPARRVEKIVDNRSDKRQVSKKVVEKKDRDYKWLDSKGRDSDHSSVSTIEDSDTIRQNILKRAKNNAPEFSKYVVSGRYLKMEKRNTPSPLSDPTPSPLSDPEPMKVLSQDSTVLEDVIMGDDNALEDPIGNDRQASRVVMKSGGETPPFSVHESYVVVDELSMSKEINDPELAEQPVHNISVIGGTSSNSMRQVHEIYDENVAVANELPDDLPLNRIVVTGNNDYAPEEIQTKTSGSSYDLVTPEPTPLSPETKKAFEDALKASIVSPPYRPESPTVDENLPQTNQQDPPQITNTVPTSSSCTGTQERVESYPDPAVSRKAKTSLKAPSSRQVHCGNRFHPYDNRVKTYQGHCHSIRQPSASEMLSENFCREEYRMRRTRYNAAAAQVAARSRDDVFDEVIPSSSRFGSLNEMSRDEGMIQRAEEVEVTHSREGSEVDQRDDQLQVLDRQIEALTASESDIQDYFILDANVYPIKNGDNSALSGVPPRNRIRRGRGRGRPPPPRPRTPPHQYQIHNPYPSRGYHPGNWNGPSGSGWSGPSQRSLDWWNRQSSRNPSPNRFYHHRKGY